MIYWLLERNEGMDPFFGFLYKTLNDIIACMAYSITPFHTRSQQGTPALSNSRGTDLTVKVEISKTTYSVASMYVLLRAVG